MARERSAVDIGCWIWLLFVRSSSPGLLGRSRRRKQVCRRAARASQKHMGMFRFESSATAMEMKAAAVVSTAEPWPEPVRGSDLLDQMAAAFSRFLVLSPVAADTEALWCLNTYAYDAAGVLANLCISSSEKRCGKTRNLEILGCLVQRPLHTANITPAALYRTIDQYQPTLLIDEADTS